MQGLTHISRAEAKERGLLRFFHGRPCLRGHISERAVASQTCCECRRLLQNNDHWKAKRRERYATAFGRIDRKSRNLKRNYGLTIEQYNAIALSQDYQCAICSKPEPRGLVVDHCHATGRVRQLLCIGCNLGLGGLKDDPKILERAAAYLRKHGKP